MTSNDLLFVFQVIFLRIRSHGIHRHDLPRFLGFLLFSVSVIVLEDSIRWYIQITIQEPTIFRIRFFGSCFLLHQTCQSKICLLCFWCFFCLTKVLVNVFFQKGHDVYNKVGPVTREIRVITPFIGILTSLIYFRPFLGVPFHPIYNDRRGPPWRYDIARFSMYRIFTYSWLKFMVDK